MKKVLIASDSTCDLNQELIDEFGVRILPLGITLGGKNYTDGVDMTPEMIYEHYEKTKELPKTCAVNISDFADFFDAAARDHCEVVLFTISKEMSSTYQNACIAAQGREGVFVVDGQNLSTGTGLLILRACEMAREGKSAEEIFTAAEEMKTRVSASFVIDDLEFLHKGGRCSALAAFGANLLQLKPCISVKDGKMGVEKKYRGKFSFVLNKYIADQLAFPDTIEQEHIFVTNAGCDPAITKACVEQVKAILPTATVHESRAGCTISSHCGRNTLGVLFIRKNS